MGKGSNRRPRLISQNEYENNWDAVFKKTENIDTPIIRGQMRFFTVVDENNWSKKIDVNETCENADDEH